MDFYRLPGRPANRRVYRQGQIVISEPQGAIIGAVICTFAVITGPESFANRAIIEIPVRNHAGVIGV